MYVTISRRKTWQNKKLTTNSKEKIEESPCKVNPFKGAIERSRLLKAKRLRSLKATIERSR
jgi:hypothetical protein